MQAKETAGAILPSGELLLDRTIHEFEVGDYIFDGQFYQTVDEQEYKRRQQTVTTYERSNIGRLPIEAYQQWVELDWKKPQGTYEAAERLSRKVKEEAWFETPRALNESTDYPKDEQLRQAALDELGDVLWTVTALASNAGVNCDQALQSKLWGDGLLSKRVPELTLDHVEGLVSEGLTPYISQHLAAHAGDDIESIKLEEMEPQKNLMFRTASLAITCEKQFGYNDTNFGLGYYQKIGQEEVAPMVADQILLIAWYAKHLLGSSLAEVVKINVPKLRQRVTRNLVDKDDGDRGQI